MGRALGEGGHDDPRAGLLRRLEQEMARSRPLAAGDVACLVGRPPRTMVQDALRVRTTGHLPPDLRLQTYLRHVVGVVSVAARHSPDLSQALWWYRTATVPQQGGRTPEELTAEGQMEDACRGLSARAANDEPLASFSGCS
jgi:hypothetical protein